MYALYGAGKGKSSKCKDVKQEEDDEAQER